MKGWVLCENGKIVCPVCKNKFIIEEVENEKINFIEVFTYMTWFFLFITAIFILVTLIFILPDAIKDVIGFYEYFIKR